MCLCVRASKKEMKKAECTTKHVLLNMVCAYFWSDATITCTLVRFTSPLVRWLFHRNVDVFGYC